MRLKPVVIFCFPHFLWAVCKIVVIICLLACVFPPFIHVNMSLVFGAERKSVVLSEYPEFTVE